MLGNGEGAELEEMSTGEELAVTNRFSFYVTSSQAWRGHQDLTIKCYLHSMWRALPWISTHVSQGQMLSLLHFFAVPLWPLVTSHQAVINLHKADTVLTQLFTFPARVLEVTQRRE